MGHETIGHRISANGDKRERVGETVVETMRTGQDKAIVRGLWLQVRYPHSSYKADIAK